MAIHYILLLIYHRREPEERAQLTDLVSKSVQTRKRQEEVSKWDGLSRNRLSKKVNKEGWREG